LLSKQNFYLGQGGIGIFLQKMLEKTFPIFALDMENKEFALLLVNNGIEVNESDSDFRAAVKNQVLYFLENDLNKLYSLLYRIDVSEQKAKDAFGGSAKEISENITELILERLLQKIESRKKYK